MMEIQSPTKEKVWRRVIIMGSWIHLSICLCSTSYDMNHSALHMMPAAKYWAQDDKITNTEVDALHQLLDWAQCAAPYEEQQYEPTRTPELPETKLSTKEYTWRDPWLQPHV